VGLPLANGLNLQYEVWKLLAAAYDGVHSMIENQDVEMMTEGALQSSRGSIYADGIHMGGRLSLTGSDTEGRLLETLTASHQKIGMKSPLTYVCNHCKVVYVTSKYFGSSGDSVAESWVCSGICT
jgi:hypothetical protein